MKKVTHTSLVVSCVSVGAIFAGMLASSYAGALTYQDETSVKFTFNSTLSIALSDADLIIGNLIPGQDDTSNAVDVVVNTNNLYGYTLTATVGSATKDYRDLRHTNGVANFASIDVNSDLSTLSGESSSVWGYTTSTNGTTWSNYSGLPKYDDTTNTAELNVTDGAAEDSTTSFKIGAFAAEGQLAGDYSNVINFKVVSNGAPEPKLYMQDVTTADCTTTPRTVYDSRDERQYTMRRLADGKCWLLDNLALDIANPTVLANIDSNTTNASSTTLGYLKGTTTRDPSTDPDGNYATAGVANWTSGSSNSAPLVNATAVDSTAEPNSGGYDDGKYGAYYNYCAATAGSYCYGNGNNAGTALGNATEDICPAGWRMPTSGDSGDYKALWTAYSQDFNNFVGALRTPVAGHYSNGQFYTQGSRGYFWSSTLADNGYYINGLSIIDGMVTPTNSYSRASGRSVRCLLQES